MQFNKFHKMCLKITVTVLCCGKGRFIIRWWSDLYNSVIAIKKRPPCGRFLWVYANRNSRRTERREVGMTLASMVARMLSRDFLESKRR